MRKALLLMGLSMLGVLLFASVALAQQGDGGGRALTGEDAGNAEAGGLGQPRVVSGSELDDDDGGGSSASASTSASASASSSASASASASGSATAAVSPLPDSGGPVSLTVLAPLALLVGSGLLAFRVIRRS